MSIISVWENHQQLHNYEFVLKILLFSCCLELKIMLITVHKFEFSQLLPTVYNALLFLLNYAVSNLWCVGWPFRKHPRFNYNMVNRHLLIATINPLALFAAVYPSVRFRLLIKLLFAHIKILCCCSSSNSSRRRWWWIINRFLNGTTTLRLLILPFN